MNLNKNLVSSADSYYDSIIVNDFSSFIISDFKNDILLDLSPERAEENITKSDEFIEYLCGLQNSDLNNDEYVIVESLLDFAKYIKASNTFYWHKFNVTHNTCPLKYVIKRLETFPLETGSQLERYMGLFSQMPKAIANMRLKLNRQYEMGLSIHDEELEISKAMFLTFRQSSKSLLDPKNRDVNLSAAQSREIGHTIANMNSEIDRLVGCLDGLMGKEFINLSKTKGGEAYYHSLIKTYTSYNLSPQEIHEIGLRELEVTKQKIRNLMRTMGYEKSLEEFHRMMLSDRRFFDLTPEHLTERFNRCLEKIRPKMSLVFKRQPQADCCARALSREQEGATSWGYYSVPIGTEKRGIFYFSAAELDRRSQIRTAAITYHELLPGHHFQVNLAKEDKHLPKISQNHFNTAFADGWAEYATDLADELSMYDEFDLYGRYVWDLVLCARLVVDTGVNALGWNIDKMRRFMAENTILSQLEIKMESLRYAVDMPGQALAYKMGSLKNHELRRMAETELKASFDIKDYHEAVLKYGSIPLNLLHKNIEEYVECTKHNTDNNGE